MSGRIQETNEWAPGQRWRKNDVYNCLPSGQSSHLLKSVTSSKGVLPWGKYPRHDKKKRNNLTQQEGRCQYRIARLFFNRNWGIYMRNSNDATIRVNNVFRNDSRGICAPTDSAALSWWRIWHRAQIWVRFFSLQKLFVNIEEIFEAHHLHHPERQEGQEDWLGSKCRIKEQNVRIEGHPLWYFHNIGWRWQFVIFLYCKMLRCQFHWAISEIKWIASLLNCVQYQHNHTEYSKIQPTWALWLLVNKKATNGCTGWIWSL